ncbi:MAG: SCO6880 family protein, partial [Stackebrandtia sp.]
TPTAKPRTYFGWQRERVNFLFGLSARRSLLLGAAAALTAWPLAVSALSAAVVCWPVAAILLATALVRINGRTLDEWAASAVSYEAGAWRNLHKFISGPWRPSGKTGPAPGQPDLPGILAPLEFYEAAYPGTATPFAIAHHRLDHTYTAVARINFSGIGLADSDHRDRRVDGWGALLASLCTEGNAIVRMQVMQRIVPESGAALRGWHDEHLSNDAPDAAAAVTEGLLSTATLATSHRETFLAFTMDAARAPGAIKTAGGGTTGASIVLTRQLRALVPQIAAADLHVETWLGPRDLAEVIRTAFDPHATNPLAERRAHDAGPEEDGPQAGVAPGAAGPFGAESQRGTYIHNGAASVTYWVADWPRSEVHPTVLGPLLAEGVHRRAFSLHYEPLPPRAAEREVMRERTSRDVAVRMRQRTGQIVPEHERVALARAEAQDAERASGHGLARNTGYITVTVTDTGDLDDACAALEADAAAARIELHRMWFAEDIGFACCALPLGYGIPKKRW